MIDKNVRILIVEDTMADAALLQRQLQKVFPDPEIRVSDSLLNTRYTVKTFIPDLVFTDFDLVGFTGEDVITNIRDLFPTIPIFIVSGTLTREDAELNSVLKHANGFFFKRNMNELHKRIEPVILEAMNDLEEEQRRLNKQRQDREKLEKVHSIIKEASKYNFTEEADKLSDYYKKIFSQLNNTIETIIK
ncbi:MAG: response regulator [Marinirhabdus sp.]|nr:response regulator [Marinirhabdus sp.]